MKRKYTIKLFPSDGRIVEGSIIKNNMIGNIGIVTNMIDRDIQCVNNGLYYDISNYTLMMYYIIYRGSIVGELSFKDYKHYDLNDDVTVQYESLESKVIHNKPELGDTVVITKIKAGDNCLDISRLTNTGVIIKLNNRDADIDLGDRIINNIKRYRYEILSASGKPKADKKLIFYTRKEWK